MLKSKIFQVLPYWLIGLIGLVALQIALPQVLTPGQSLKIQSVQAGLPEVLGASTTLRGQVPDPLPPLAINNPVNTAGINAKSFLAFDLDTGLSLLGKNPDQKLQIASLTKLMTALVAYQNADLNKSFEIGPKDLLAVSPSLGLKIGDNVRALDVFNSMIVGSCNDAALALANYAAKVSGQNFVGLMNDLAKQLGMASSSFSNPIGFDSQNNYSTANDLKLLISVTQKLSVFNDLARRSGYNFISDNGQAYSVIATNKLLQGHPDIFAIKTGFTNEAHGAMATEITLRGHHVVILVLDSQNRENDTLKLKQILEQTVIQ